MLSAFAGLIDGMHATAGSDLRTVLSVGAQRLWMSTLANTQATLRTQRFPSSWRGLASCVLCAGRHQHGNHGERFRRVRWSGSRARRGRRCGSVERGYANSSIRIHRTQRLGKSQLTMNTFLELSVYRALPTSHASSSWRKKWPEYSSRVPPAAARASLQKSCCAKRPSRPSQQTSRPLLPRCCFGYEGLAVDIRLGRIGWYRLLSRSGKRLSAPRMSGKYPWS